MPIAQIELADPAQTGQSVLDHGITDLLVHDAPGGATLYATSAVNGGLTAYRIAADGGLTLLDHAHFGPGFAASATDGLALVATGGGPRLVVAADALGSLTTYSLGADGSIGLPGTLGGLAAGGPTPGAVTAWGVEMLFVAREGPARIETYQIGANDGLTLMQSVSTGTALHDAALMAVTPSGSGDMLVGAFDAMTGVVAYSIDPAGLQQTGSLGAAEGIGLMTPTALEVVDLGGRIFVVLGSAPGDGVGQSGAITVMELHPDGSLTATDHVLDTLATRFGRVQSLEVVEDSGFTYVIAAGSDGGATLFALLPTGRLQVIGSVEGGAAAGLDNVTALASSTGADGTHVFVASETSPGVAALRIDTSRTGDLLIASGAGGTLSGTALNDILVGGEADDNLAGSFGDDILEDGPGQDTLTGGSGEDVFVLRSDATPDVISDFEAGRDKIDLSSWPFFYDPAQLTVTPTATGAIVSWRSETLDIETLNGTTLTAAEVQAAILAGVQRTPAMLVAPPSPDDLLVGTDADDTLDGGDGHDTIDGRAGQDTLLGGVGDDSIMAGSGEDSVEGGDGHDTLLGEAGFDTLRGGAGDDSLSGGPQADALHGDDGDDTLEGGDGMDNLWGGEGADHLRGDASNDWIYGGDGDDSILGGIHEDRLFGEAGGDTLRGEAGFDLLRGGDGNDLLDGGPQADNLYGDAGNDTLIGGDGFDRLFGGADDDLLVGGSGPDAVFGDTGDDTLYGDADDDRFFGGEGNDLIVGGAGQDSLSGGAGFDTLEGGAGDDRLWGDFNADTFVFGEGHGEDTIEDFDAANGFDRIDLSGIASINSLDDLLGPGGAAEQIGSHVRITTGDGGFIWLMNVDLADLDASDFLF